MGVSPSILHGRAWFPGDPLFTPTDLAMLREYKAWKAEVCGRCGTRQEAWLDDEGVPLREPPYLPAPYECPGCKAVTTYTDPQQDNDKKASQYRRTILAPADMVRAMDEE